MKGGSADRDTFTQPTSGPSGDSIKWSHPNLSENSDEYNPERLDCYDHHRRSKGLKKLVDTFTFTRRNTPEQRTHTVWSLLPGAVNLTYNTLLGALYDNGSFDAMASGGLNRQFNVAPSKEERMYGRSINVNPVKSRWRLDDLQKSHILQNIKTIANCPANNDRWDQLRLKRSEIRREFDRSHITGELQCTFDERSITLRLISYDMEDESKIRNRRETRITFLDDMSAAIYFKNENENDEVQVIAPGGLDPGMPIPLPEGITW
ncbi:uncharacterized protein L199_000060 [Kwoniella botswanensis]|uniref:uncharacterized protein n=1 Tax=Kwoniella botswanensis TaxID=1268659 RepID=UPI00315C634D